MFNPWDRFAPATLEFCESLLMGWIRQPANTFSNLGFVIVGWILWKRTPATKPWLRIFSIGSILVGLTSMVFHASMTFVAQFFDVSSMFLTAGMIVALNAMRLGLVSREHLYRFLFGMVFLAMALEFFVQGAMGEWFFAGQITFIVLSEIYLIRRNRPSFRSYRWWACAAASYASATFVWGMDIQKVWCNPENHVFNGHAAWHLLNALVVYFLHKFYEEIIPIS